MQFIVSSTGLLSRLQAVSKAISGKTTIPILDHFLFDLQDGMLTITASDLETTMITHVSVENPKGNGSIALEAKRLLDILKEFPEQPLTVEINDETLQTDMLTMNGKFSVVGAPGDEFPKVSELKEEDKNYIKLESDVLETGINKTLFAAANDELRPVMNGVFVALSPDHITFVASDSHKLVKYRRTDVKAESDSSFILPKKPASLLKNILPQIHGEVSIEFDKQNAVFSLQGYKLICRLTEGQFPNYESVIPKNNPNKLIINRSEFYNAVKRVSVFSNQASNLVKLELSDSEMVVSAQDIDFSISAYEKLNCQFEGEAMEMGFKSVFLNEILSNISADEVVFELSDPGRAGVMVPFGKDFEPEEQLMLLMPMMLH